ncbi:hypothetical protein AAG570_006795 [Ranatra chinensis]|uniref:Uncharacterized protein n=1 Tax=Ranatra chinensis TaxID=642074 RepID=A0ABD0YV38_9HEMI
MSGVVVSMPDYHAVGPGVDSLKALGLLGLKARLASRPLGVQYVSQMIDPLGKDGPGTPASCEDEARAAKILQKKRERLKREKEMTDAALRLYSTRKLTKIVEEEEETPPVEICSMKKKSWECTNQLDKTVDYRLAGMNSVQRLVFKYFGPGPDLAVDSPTSPSSGSSPPRYPHTEQSRLNRRQQILRQKQKKSDEVRDTLINKIEELTRLKKRLAEGSGRYRCHLAERKADLAERKRKFAEELALKYNLPVEALHKHADKIYENYRFTEVVELDYSAFGKIVTCAREVLRSVAILAFAIVSGSVEVPTQISTASEVQNLAQEKKLEREKLEHQLEVYNKILAERKKTIPLNISRKRPKPKQDTLTEEVTDILDEDVQEVEEGSTKKEEGDKETGEGKKTVARKKITLKTKKDKGKENRVGKSKKKSGKEEEEKKGTAKKKTGSSQKVEKQPPRQPAAPELESKENLFFPEILGGIGELEALEREKLEFQKSIQPLPLEKGLVSVPASVVIKDYKPDQSYKCKIRLKNITRHAIFCRFSNINYVKGDSYYSLEMEARDRERLAPGLVAEFTLSFHPIDETQETEAIVQFVTDTSNGERRLFQVSVHCSPPAARPTILTQSIVFPKVNVWTDKVHKKFLKIANSGVEPCTASIKKRVVETPQFDMAKEEGDNEDAGRMEKDGGDETEITQTENMVDDVGPHEADNMVKSLIEELVDNVFQVFRFDQLYAIAVEANSEVKIPVAFVATMMPYAGYALDQYDVLFQGKFVAKDKQTFSIEGEIEPLPIELWPPVIDMKQCLIGGDVQQSTLSIINRSHIPYPVSIKFPQSLACHVDVDPSDVFAHPNSSITVVVRIMLRWSFLNEASIYFDPETKVLDFPLFVDVYSRQHEGARRLEASVLAVVTAAQDLTISPDVVDLGPVTTMETCQATLFITNNSLAPHQFAFLDTPKWVTIMPNYGMGAIEPGERVRLHLLYSPGADQVEQPGDDQCHDFTISCTTMTAVANHPQLPIKAHRHADMSQVCTSPKAGEAYEEIGVWY